MTKRQKQQSLPGFPKEDTFQTKEEVDAYFSYEHIQCLMCGKWYAEINHMHLGRIHDMTVDEYKERFGLPWGRGLLGQAALRKRSEIGKQKFRDGKVGIDSKKGSLAAQKVKNRPMQPYVARQRIQRALAVHQRKTPWQHADFEEVLRRMETQQRGLRDVCSDPDVPGYSAWHRYSKSHPELAAKLKTIKQYVKKGGKRVMTPGKIEAANILLSHGMPAKDVAQNLEVSLSTLYRWCPVFERKHLVETHSD
jgi:transposase